MQMNVEPGVLCQKIRDIYPEVGRCGIDVKADFDRDKEAWIVKLRRDDQELHTHLEPEDVQACLEDERCVNLGTQIGQLNENVDKV